MFWIRVFNHFSQAPFDLYSNGVSHIRVVLVSVFAFRLRDFDKQYGEGDRRHHGSMNTINMDCRLFYFISVCVVTQYMHRFSAVHALFGHHGHLIGGNLLRNFSREVSKLFFSMHVHSVFLMWPPQSLQKGKSSKPSTICFSELDSVVEFVQLGSLPSLFSCVCVSLRVVAQHLVGAKSTCGSSACRVFEK